MYLPLYLYLYVLYLCLFLSDGVSKMYAGRAVAVCNHWLLLYLSLYLYMFFHLYLLYLLYLCLYLCLMDGCLKQDVGPQSSGG